MVERWSRVTSILTFMALTVGLAAQTNANRVLPAKIAASASSNPFDDFQSFSVLLNGGVADDHDRRLYRSGNLMRSDFEGSYRITDLKDPGMWGVQPNYCVQFPAVDASSYPFSAYHDFKVERSSTGENETVDGHACKIENVTFTQPDGGAVVVKMKLWEAEDLRGFPVKIEAEVNGRPLRPLHYSDVSFEPPDPKLFHHPAKCTEGPQAGQKGTVKVAPVAPK